MTKEELSKIISDESTEVVELIKDNAYIIEIEVGDMPKERLIEYLQTIAKELDLLGLHDVLLLPTVNGIGHLRVLRVKDKSVLGIE